MRTIIFFSAFILFLITGCSKTTGTKEVMLRIENLANYKLDSVVVVSPGGRQVYDNITANSRSEYRKFEFIYNYAYIKAYYGNQYAIMQPIDYVGETKIENGKYTYRLFIISNFTSNYITVENQKD